MSKSNVSVGTGGWSNRINDAWRKSTEAIFVTGGLLIECKETVAHGEFLKMVETDLLFSPRVAQQLMAIAKDNRLLNASHDSYLPASYATLYEMTRLSDDEFDQALKSGTISPKMKRADVQKKRKKPPQGDAVQAVGAGGPSPAGEDVATPQDAAKGEDSGVTAVPHAVTLGITTPQDAAKAEESGITSNIDCDHDWITDPISGIRVCAFCRVDAPGLLEEVLQHGAAGTIAGRALGPVPSRPAQARSLALGNDEGSPARPSDGRVIFNVGADPISRFSNGLLLAINASHDLAPAEAAVGWPEDILILADEVADFINWLYEYQIARRTNKQKGIC